MPTSNNDEPTPDELLASAITIIQRTWARIRKGPYGKQILLQKIYQIYCEWGPTQRCQIGQKLAQQLSEDRRATPHLLELLIHAALPMIEPQVVRLWAEAIRLGEACRVRPSKLRGFLYAKGGLVRCAGEFRERQAEEQRRAEEQRQAEEDERAEKRRQRWQQRQNKKGAPSRGILFPNL